ncbi:hypothetical protein IV203_013375 [Nitzschia inconspicua]|uniref:Uncharacterized protein n=1 Tax=Nitzschia inconspicua TaxID=303405 RepID=A0A9K3Q2H4_9STRA|nr:hypothetical protein IV203_031246 [Nitzschia inconspicua]KAG7374280.1 hypothetical protein IV203_013375 [Nitzschia inconspicua]
MTSRNGSSSEVESWRKSKAKAFVKELLQNNNEMYMDMPEAQLYRLYPQHFGQYSQNRFICNVKTLKKTIREVREANALKQSCPGGENYKRKQSETFLEKGLRLLEKGLRVVDVLQP